VASTTAVRLLCISFTILSYINILLVTFSANPHTLTLPLKNGDSPVIPEKLALSRVAAASVSMTLSPFAASVA
jgi:predicted cobalt transporter CbtA